MYHLNKRKFPEEDPLRPHVPIGEFGYVTATHHPVGSVIGSSHCVGVASPMVGTRLFSLHVCLVHESSVQDF